MDYSQKQREIALKQKPEPIWFFKRGDGFLFQTNEQDAWNILHNPSRWARRDFTLVGHSDGTTYFEVIRNGKKELQDLQNRAIEINKDLTLYNKSFEKFKFEQMLSDDDDRVVKAKESIKKLQEEYDEAQEKMSNFNKYLLNKAMEEEFKKAEGNIVAPSNQDIITPEGRREEILKVMPR